MQYLIINADDFGANETVNLEIERFIKNGWITSTTIMANGKALEQSIEISKKYPHISYGIHLNLSELTSLTKSDVLKANSIIDDKGDFIKGNYLTTTYTTKLKEAIYHEWKAQIEKIKSLGVKISHMDGHHHCHTKHELYDVLKKLSIEYNIKCVRNSYSVTESVSAKIMRIIEAKRELKKNQYSVNTIHTPLPKGNESAIMTFINRIIWRYKVKCNFKRPDYFTSYSNFVQNNFKTNQLTRTTTIELMCHPGSSIYENESLSIINHAENIKNKFKLITYKDLK